MCSVPFRVVELVETFDRDIEAYRSQQYNETQLRREFIDPFFEELGWDITNKQGFAPQYREVIHENSIKISGETKAPDYSFRIGGVRKFFLEATKPSLDIKADVYPAYHKGHQIPNRRGCYHKSQNSLLTKLIGRLSLISAEISKGVL